MNEAAYKLSLQYNVETLLSAYVYAAVAQANEMTMDMINDPGYVREEGMPSRQKMVDTAIGFATEGIPANLIDDDEYMGKCTARQGENILNAAIRAAVEAAYAPGSPFGVIKYQIPGTHPCLADPSRMIDN